MEPTAVQVELDGQYRALREAAGYLWPPRAVLLVKGPDAADYLQGQLTNDVEGLDPGTGCYAALLDRKGHLVADMRVLRLESAGEEIWLDLEPGAGEAALRHLRTYSIGRDVQIEEAGELWRVASVIGPGASRLTGFEGIGPEYVQRHRDWDDTEVLAVATNLGVDLIVRAGQAEALEALLRAAGIAEVSADAAEIVRVESGRPRFGLDIGPEQMPAEAGIVERAVDFEKGCYIGQEPVARLHYRGKPNRGLRGLRLSAPAATGEPLRVGDKEVGILGSSVLSPAFGPIALGVVRREAEAGARLSVGDGKVTAEVVELPFRA